MTATRASFGAISRRNCKRLAARSEEGYARDVASGMGEARHKAGLNRIVTHRHDDGYRTGRNPCRWCYVATECEYQIRFERNADA
jgi:hypothetical protein